MRHKNKISGTLEWPKTFRGARKLCNYRLFMHSANGRISANNRHRKVQKGTTKKKEKFPSTVSAINHITGFIGSIARDSFLL